MIQPGQIYTACDGSGTLIRIVDEPRRDWQAVRVTVETVLASGRAVRRRPLAVRQLHDSATTTTGQPRRTGYALTPDSAFTAAPAAEPDVPTVRVGQIWQDNDKRGYGRQLRIEAIDGTHAKCHQVHITQHGYTVLSTPLRTTRIKLVRFRPTSTGYVLIRDAEETS